MTASVSRTALVSRKLLVSRKVLGDLIAPGEGTGPWLKRAAMILAGVAALWVSAKVRIAIEPVPVTLQVLVVMSIGMAYGARMAVATLMAYLALGAAGAPVFAGTPEKGIGLAYMLGGTGGYLLGFVAAAGVVGWLAGRGWDRSMPMTALAMAIGLATLYVPGVLWLAYGFPLAQAAGGFSGLGIGKAVEFGLFPFLGIDALKLAVAVIAFPAVWRLAGDAR